MTVSVVICAYTTRRRQALLDAVASVDEQTRRARETIVVIDHNDELLWDARAALPGARVIANGSTQGLSGARNSGVAAARGEIVAFLDDDAVAARDWLAELLAPFDDPAVLGAGGIARPAWHGGEAPAWLPEEFYWTIGCSYLGLPTTTAPIRNPIGASMAFRRSALQRIEGFNDGLGRIGTTPLGCEETELSIRVRRAHPEGMLLHVPRAIVEHAVASERASWRYFLRRCWAEGLSKARVSREVGPADGLASERLYTLRTLPRGFVRGLLDGLRGDVGGPQRAIAIALGLLVTAGGYARGRGALR